MRSSQQRSARFIDMRSPFALPQPTAGMDTVSLNSVQKRAARTKRGNDNDNRRPYPLPTGYSLNALATLSNHAPCSDAAFCRLPTPRGAWKSCMCSESDAASCRKPPTPGA